MRRAPTVLIATALLVSAACTSTGGVSSTAAGPSGPGESSGSGALAASTVAGASSGAGGSSGAGVSSGAGGSSGTGSTDGAGPSTGADGSTVAPSSGAGTAPSDETGCAVAGLPTTVAYRRLPGVPRNATSLDVYAPDGACDVPVVVWVHGGGYHHGDKANAMAAKQALFNRRGWILVSVNYRLTRVGDPSSAHYPDHYEDVAASLAWVDATIAHYGGDPGRLALLGHSAGADIVANVAAEPRYLTDRGLGAGTIDCLAPLDTAGYDKPRASIVERRQWDDALGNHPAYLTDTSATLLLRSGRAAPPPATLSAVRGSPHRQDIARDYLDAVDEAGARTVTVDARSLTHGQVSSRIGAPGDTVMTPPLVHFLRTCFAPT